MQRLSAHVARIAFGISTMLVLSTVSSWAQSPPTLPPSLTESPEFRAQLDAAAADPMLEPWQREFMRGMVGADAVRGAVEAAPGAIEAGDASGDWNQLPWPTVLADHTAIYDPVRDRMVVFAGRDAAFSFRNEVWALSLSGTATWSTLSPTGGTPPTARYGHTAIYDPVRDRMVIFAGFDGSRRNDVWALSLSGTPVWSELSPTGTPPTARYRHTAIYDPVRDRMVVFAGNDGSSRNDVWALSLSGTPAWSTLSPTGTPPIARYAHTAIYDPMRDRMVVFAGQNVLRLNDVWVLSLAGTPAWSALSPAGTTPTARSSHTAIYDPVRDRMVIFAGFDGSSDRSDVWALVFSGTPTWSTLSPTGTPPSARYAHTAIYDPGRDRMLAFAGNDDSSYRDDAWALSLSGTPAWSALRPTATPPPGRYRHTAIYDPVRDRMVVFGGSASGGSQLNDVWTLSLSGAPAWSELSPTGTPPTTTSGQTAIYDPLRDRMVVFGGQGGPSPSHLWALTLSSVPAWSTLSPTGTPPTARYLHTAIYDPVRDRMLVFAGQDGSLRNDAWVLSLSDTPAWSALSPAGTPPPARYLHTAIYDLVHDRMVVFGGWGGSQLNDVWALSLSGTPAWSALSPAGTTPTARSSHTAIYDPVRDRMVIFAGFDGSSDRSDVWALSLSGTPVWSELSPTGTPPAARYGHTAIYDPERERMVVFAGLHDYYRNDVWWLNWASLVDVDPEVQRISGRFELAPPRPNPSRGSVSFDISIPHASQVSLVIHDSAGRVVHRFGAVPFAPGRHVLVWDRRYDDGGVVPSGVYFVRLIAPGVLLTRKTILIQ